ncbi:hypothetical protein VB712_08015 [Spirulina sp. CCNP1310]|uniref:hypothetical protein n=1 Tax=Spirulina sp. CCNP1310 TaxID=3110249 RepID=UPI002B21F909|nr:hypothetical protein [Spirulina sp. CCNP1310]MEA5419173.1 hypothetical protein [Spirulina sp. CCNP1310]
MNFHLGAIARYSPLLLITALTLACSNPAQAQTTTLTQCDEAGLRRAIDSTPNGSQINFQCPANTTINLAAEIQLGKTLSFNGRNSPNLTINGQNRTRLFRLANQNLTLQNLKLRGGSVPNPVASFSCEGGAIHITRGTLTLNNVILESNNGARGGAICGNYQAALVINNSQFIGNTANQGGAIMSHTSDLRITNSTFRNNTTRVGQNFNGSGGAIYTFDALNKQNPILIQGSRFEGNKAYHEGGAAFISQGNGVNAIIRNSTFYRNEALIDSQGIGSGGAIRLAHAGAQSNTQIVNVVFAENAADQEGGALWAGGGRANLHLNLNQVTFTDNKAGRVPDPEKNETGGGAMLLATGLESRVVINYTTFVRNEANHETSGAIYLNSDFVGGNIRHQNITLRNSIFDRNCSRKPLAGMATPTCSHLVHATTMRRDGSNFLPAPLAGENVFEWIQNVHQPSGTRFGLTANSQVRDAKVRPYRDSSAATPNHPCSDVDAGSGRLCQ